MMMKPIGFVSSVHKNPAEIKKACEEGLAYRGRSSIVFNKELTKGLEDLKEFSHAWVIFHLDMEKRVEIRDYPRSPKDGVPEVSIYASRSPCRTNHIGLRLVRIVSLDGRELVVEGLDAIDRSPVLDIKPLVPRFDLPEREDVKTAGWYEW